MKILITLLLASNLSYGATTSPCGFNSEHKVCQKIAEMFLDNERVQNKGNAMYTQCYNDIYSDGSNCIYRRSLFSLDVCPEVYHKVIIDLKTQKISLYETNRDEPQFCPYPD